MTPVEQITGPSPKEAWGGFRVEVLGEAELPISGGWGYTREDACVIEVEDSWQGIALEKKFARRRIMEELIVRRHPIEAFRDLEWDMEMQSLHSHEGRHYDCLVFEISGIPQKDWMSLKMEFEGPKGARSEEFDFADYSARREACKVRFKREFWYDITKFYGRDNFLGAE